MTYHVTDRIRLTPAQFLAMRVCAKPDNIPGPPEMLFRVLVGGRWHACDRQYQFGQPVHFARPIVVVMTDKPYVPRSRDLPTGAAESP